MKLSLFSKNLLSAIIVFLYTCGISMCFGTSVSEHDALLVASNWLKYSKGIPFTAKNNKHLKIASIKSYTNDQDKVIYYELKLLPKGYIIISGDDVYEPILAFSSVSNYSKENNILDSIFSHSARNSSIKALNQSFNTSKNAKWDKYKNYTISETLDLGMAETTINQIRIKPFVLSEWNQMSEFGKACYNWYTPSSTTEWVPGNASNYPCGCAVTAAAQVIRYYQHPKTAIGPIEYEVTVDDVPTMRNILGGDEKGGAYQWRTMILKPYENTPEIQRKAIGALIHDVAISSNVHFSAADSETFLSKIHQALLSTFKFQNAIFTIATNSNQLTDDFERFQKIVNPNIDAKCPVIFALSGTAGHTVVCDGYGYNDSTPFYHINMGWGGYADGWYNLPEIISGSNTFDRLFSCIYNIFPEKTGEIISGRLLNSKNLPLQGIKISARIENGETFYTYSETNGIFAFKNVPSNATITLKCGNFDGPTIHTGESGKPGTSEDEVGNVWDIKFNIDKVYNISGSFNGARRSGITVEITGDANITILSSYDGYFSFSVPAGHYTIKPVSTDAIIYPQEQTVTVSDASIKLKSFYVDSFSQKFTSGSILQFDLSNNKDIELANIKKYKFYILLGKKQIRLKNLSNDSLQPELIFNKKISLYKHNKYLLKKQTDNILTLINDNKGLNCNIFLKGKTTDGQFLNIKIGEIILSPPKVLSINDNKGQEYSIFGPGAEVTLKGKFFGQKIKYLYLYSSSGAFYKAKISKKYIYEDYKSKPAYMNPLTGDSLVKFRIPEKIPTGSYKIIMSNGTGIACEFDLEHLKQVLPIISIQ